MIDFSTLKGLTIPEGNVKQISDAQGNVLWSAKPSTATITVNSIFSDYAEVSIPGFGAVSSGTYEVPVGTVLNCWIEANSNDTSTIKVNDVTVASCSDGDTEYQYTATKDVYITIDGYNGGPHGYCYIIITEIPEGQILFTINDEKYFAEEGMTWGEWVDSDYNPLYGSYTDRKKLYEVQYGMISNLEESLVVYDPNADTYELMYFGPNTLIKANYAYRLGKD